MKNVYTIAMRKCLLLYFLAMSTSTSVDAASATAAEERAAKKNIFCGGHGNVKERLYGLDCISLVNNPSVPSPLNRESSWLFFFQDAKDGSGSPKAKPSPKASPPKKYPPSEFNISVTGGRGLIRAGSPYTLESGELAVAANVVNFDRNPGDVDFFDFPVQIALGLPGRTEFYFSMSPVVRTNSVGQDPLGYPVPPLDLFIDTYPSSARRPEPYFLFAQEVPYKTYFVPDVTIDPPGHGAFASSSGDVVLGLKVNVLSEERDDSMGFAVRGYVEIPTEQPVYNTFATTSEWRQYAGFSGEKDFGLDLLVGKKLWGTDVLFNLGYKKVGDTSRGLRIQYVDSSRTGTDGFLVGQPVEAGLELRDELVFTAGTYLPAFEVLSHQVWFLGELSYLRYLGAGTPVERKVNPFEMRLAIQFNFPWYQKVSVGLGWQLLFNDAGDGDYRTTLLQTPDGLGDINFSELVDPALSEQVQEFLSNQGATFSYNSSKVLSTNNPAFDAWRNISTDRQMIIGKGGGNWVVFLTWRVGSLW